MRPIDWKVCRARLGINRVSAAMVLYWAPGIESDRPLSKSDSAFVDQEVGVEPQEAGAAA